MSWLFLLACKSPIVEADYLAVTSLSPAPEADGVAVDAQIFATFNEPLVADTVHDASVSLAAHDGTSIALEVLYDEADNVVVATPIDPLSYDTAYALHISSDVEGVDTGPLLAAVEMRFRTGEPGPGPSNRAPVAHAGNDAFAIAAGADYHLDGTASTDPERQSLDYHWRLVSRPLGSSAFVEVPDAADPVMRPDVSGAYLVGLVVDDGYNQSDEDLVELLAIGPME
jgi:hypothetical protein